MSFNAIEPDERTKYEGIVNNSIDNLIFLKAKNWLVAGHPNSMSFYSI